MAEEHLPGMVRVHFIFASFQGLKSCLSKDVTQMAKKPVKRCSALLVNREPKSHSNGTLSGVTNLLG
jgi:hypothetical protein